MPAPPPPPPTPPRASYFQGQGAVANGYHFSPFISGDTMLS